MTNNEYTVDWFRHQSEESLNSARAVVPKILNNYKPNSVVEFGCGVGPWGKVFLDAGIQSYIGVDGDYINRSQLLFPEKFFMAQDLNKSEAVGRFDLCLCLETAEHIEEKNAVGLVQTLCESADIIVFSAAIPNQSGTGHINEQWQSYWAEIFSKQGFEPSLELREEIWKVKNVSWWYVQNIVTYKRVKYTPAIPNNIDVAHPRAFEYLAVDRDNRVQERDWAIAEKIMATTQLQISHSKYLDIVRKLWKVFFAMQKKIARLRLK
jgi:Methyltransferase domain